MSDQPSWKIRFIDSIHAVEPAAWDALVDPGYPFLRHAFLAALEDSGCCSERSGWLGQHLLLESADGGDLLGCLPLYLKSNSYGEYVFDWSWADAYARHGLDYYPKLLSAIPFTPCAGPRLSLHPSLAEAEATEQVIDAIKSRLRTRQLSSFHLLFPDAKQLASLQQQSLLLRTGCQYQWFNRDYSDFEAFLASLNSRKRKNLRKERRQVQAENIEFLLLEGEQIEDSHCQSFYHFYRNTYLVRGRPPYLNLEFFQRLVQGMPEQLLLILARQDDRDVAAALFFKGSDTLYGRYWGSTDEFRFLHFETCYYQGIDYCIRHGLRRFDSGAQGEHKIQRGFEPVPTWSLHWIEHPQFRQAIEDFVRDEEAYIRQYLEHAADFLPFRRDLELDKPSQHGA